MSSNGPRPTSEGNRPENRRPERRPVRRHGVWREFISSTGKSYYFNVQTQENRWDKPDDWPVEDRPGDIHRNRHNGKPGDIHRKRNGQNHPRIGSSGHNRSQRPQQRVTPSKNLLDEIRLIANNQDKTNQNSTADNDNSNRPHEASHSRQSSTSSYSSNLTPAGFRGGTGPDTPSNGSSSVHAAPLKKRWRATPLKGTTEGDQHGSQKQTTNGLSANSIFNRIQKRHRVDDFKRLIDERPKLPEFEMSDFEALRPFIDNNLISEEVRKLTHEPNEKQTLDMIPSKSKLQTKLAYNSTKLKSLRANVRRHQVMRSYLDDRLTNYRSEMKILIEGNTPNSGNRT